MKLKTSCNVEQTFTLEVFLDSRENEVEVKVTVGFEWQNNGIGAYEYWGSKGYDNGINYLEPVEILWDSAGFTAEEVKEIEKEIYSSLESWSNKAERDSEEIYDWKSSKNTPLRWGFFLRVATFRQPECRNSFSEKKYLQDWSSVWDSSS